LKARYNLEDVGIDGKGWDGMDWIHLAEDRDWWQAEALEYIKGMKFLH
jgi:hypothetical protein